MRTSDVTQLMDLALGLWFPFVRIMAFLRYMPIHAPFASNQYH